jgi:1-acyl-sn-glycerol-3-phosphate acyltransferase
MFRLVFSLFYFIATLVISALTFLPVVLFLRLVGLEKLAEAITFKLMHYWGRYIVLVGGGSVRIKGLEKLPASDNICFYSNHQDYSDIVLYLGWMNRAVGFIGKKELGAVPIMSTWMKLSHSLFLDRGSLKEGFRVITRAAGKIRKGQAIVIFPEGHRNHGGPLAEFKAGSFKISKLSGGYIVPVTIDGSWRFLSQKGKVSGGRIDLTVHDPIDAGALSKDEWKDIPKRVQATIESAIKQRPLLSQ